MSKKRLNTGARVAFRLADAVCPDFDQIVGQIGLDLTVSGQVVLLSDRGVEKEHFAIVNVSGINAALIVPVHKLQRRVADDADVARQP